MCRRPGLSFRIELADGEISEIAWCVMRGTLSLSSSVDIEIRVKLMRTPGSARNAIGLSGTRVVGVGPAAISPKQSLRYQPFLPWTGTPTWESRIRVWTEPDTKEIRILKNSTFLRDNASVYADCKTRTGV